MADLYDDPLADGPVVDAAYMETLTKAAGRIGGVGFRPTNDYDFVIWKEDDVYYRRDGSDGEVDDSDTDAAKLINNAFLDMSTRGKLRLKGTIEVDRAITLDGNVVGLYNYWQIDFDTLQTQQNVDIFNIKSMRRPLNINGLHMVAYPGVHTTNHSFFKMEEYVEHLTVNVGWLEGDITTGKTYAMYFDINDGYNAVNNKINITYNRYLDKVLFMDLAGNAWASINKFNLGWFEGQSPQQIHLYDTGTGSIHHNVITGCGGAPDSFNPQAHGTVYTIKLETGGTAVILGTTFRDLYLYSTVDEVYRADSGVTGTRFIGGMPRQDQTAFWHDAGIKTDFISCYIPDVGSGSKQTGQMQIVEHHTALDTLTRIESGSIHTNLGAGGNFKLTLPQDAQAGDNFEFVVMAAHQLEVDPGAAGAIYINGAKQADDAHIWADDEAESVKLVADGNGDWAAMNVVGVWTVV